MQANQGSKCHKKIAVSQLPTICSSRVTEFGIPFFRHVPYQPTDEEFSGSIFPQISRQLGPYIYVCATSRQITVSCI